MTEVSTEAQALQDKILLRMSEGDRLMPALEMSALARDLAPARMRSRHPHWTVVQCRRELLRAAFMPEPLPPGLP